MGYSCRGVEHLGNPTFQLDLSQLSPLLEKETLTSVSKLFVDQLVEKIDQWTRNLITTEIKVCIFPHQRNRSSKHEYYTRA